MWNVYLEVVLKYLEKISIVGNLILRQQHAFILVMLLFNIVFHFFQPALLKSLLAVIYLQLQHLPQLMYMYQVSSVKYYFDFFLIPLQVLILL